MSPTLTLGVKYFPFNFTVSRPTCINISAPLSETILRACFVSITTATLPSIGEYSFPSLGSIAIPFPNISSPNVGSLILELGTAIPFIGATKTSSGATTFFFKKSNI